MPEELGSMDVLVINWFGILVGSILGFLQIRANTQGQGLGYFQKESQAVSVLFSISFTALTASIPLPSSKLFRISIFCAILACSLLLSSCLPSELGWVPHLSGIRPFFHLLPESFQGRIRQFSRTVWNEADERVLAPIKQLLAAAIERLASIYAGPLNSEPSLEDGSVEEGLPQADVAAAAAASSSALSVDTRNDPNYSSETLNLHVHSHARPAPNQEASSSNFPLRS